MLETEAEGRDADDELAARLEAGEVVSLGGKVLAAHLLIILGGLSLALVDYFWRIIFDGKVLTAQ